MWQPGLPAMAAVIQQPSDRPTAIASKLSSHSGSGCAQHPGSAPNPVGAGLAPRWRRYIQQPSDRPTAIASKLLPQWTWVCTTSRFGAEPCGSRACPRWRRYIQQPSDRPTAIASKLSSHSGPGCAQHPGSALNPVGAGLARDGGGTFSSLVTDTPLSRASSAPTVDLGVHNIQVRH